MNKLKSKYPNIDIIFTSLLLMLFFWVFCTKLIIKMDDGHFSGILANESFNLKEWLVYRYQNTSGRTVGEALMMSFLGTNLIFWKLLSFGLFAYITYFISKVADSFAIHNNQRQVALLSSSSMFLVFVGVLNAGAFWFAGSFTFLIPCGFMFIALTPAVFSVLEIKCALPIKIAAVPLAIIAASQEQAAVCTCAMLVCLFAISAAKKSIRITAYLPLIPAAAATVYLLSSPGAKERGINEAALFPAYRDFGLIKKLFLGFSNYCSYTFFFSVFITLIFTLLLSLLLRDCYTENKTAAKLSVIAPSSVVFVALVYNVLHTALAKGSVDTHFKKCFKSDKLDLWCYLTMAVCAAVIILWATMIILIIRKNPKAGLSVGLLCCAAFGCGMIMSFSSSIYSSGKRVFFYSELLMVTACVILFANIKPSKLSKIILGICLTAAGIFYAFDVFNFTFFEIPIMN